MQFGRTKIKTDVEKVNRNNVLSVLADALTAHNANRADIDYLYRYFKGDQPVLAREKEM